MNENKGASFRLQPGKQIMMFCCAPDEQDGKEEKQTKEKRVVLTTVALRLPGTRRRITISKRGAVFRIGGKELVLKTRDQMDPYEQDQFDENESALKTALLSFYDVQTFGESIPNNSSLAYAMDAIIERAVGMHCGIGRTRLADVAQHDFAFGVAI